MRSYCTDYLATMPDITVYINCDTRLAIKLSTFDLTEYDEFIFAIKNYNYADSPSVFLFRATTKDMDSNGEVLFKITPEASKFLKPGAFYNFAVLKNAFNTALETEYRKLTANGTVLLEYGAQDILIDNDLNNCDYIITDIRLEELGEQESSDVSDSQTSSDMKLERLS